MIPAWGDQCPRASLYLADRRILPQKPSILKRFHGATGPLLTPTGQADLDLRDGVVIRCKERQHRPGAAPGEAERASHGASDAVTPTLTFALAKVQHPAAGELPFRCEVSMVKAKLVSVIVLLLLFGTPLLASHGFRSVFYEDFEGISPPALPAGWVTVNANGDTGTWDTRTYGGYKGGPNCMRYFRDPYQGADDWFFTSGISVTAGQTYTLEFMYRASDAAFPEALSVFAGTAQNAGGMTIPLWSDPAITNTDFLEAVGGFVAPSSGTYYIGFHAESAVNMRRLYVDDLNLTVPETDLELRMGLTQELYQTGTLTYTLGDSIECMTYIVNNGSTPVVINEAFSVGSGGRKTYVDFEIEDPFGLPVTCLIYYSKMGPLEPHHFSALYPDSVSGKFIDLYEWHDFREVGLHTIRAHYRNYTDPFSTGAWMGELVSDPVVIELE
jgi:hypothetical protein